MKKYFGLVALIIALGATAFTKTNHSSKHLTNFYWYNPVSGVAFPNNPQPEPSSECMELGTGCAIGFSSPQSDPVHGSPTEFRKVNTP